MPTEEVRGFVDGTESTPEFLGEEFRVLDRYELQADLVETLKQTENHSNLAAKVAACPILSGSALPRLWQEGLCSAGDLVRRSCVPSRFAPACPSVGRASGKVSRW